jgi:hypothetical protein
MSSQQYNYAAMLFYIVRENIGLINYAAKEREWGDLKDLAKQKFSEFANVVSQLKTVEELETETAKKEPPEWKDWRTDIFTRLKERRPYTLTSGQKAGEAKQMSWLFRQGFTPDQIIRAFDAMNSQPFWSDKPLTLMTVAKQIGAMMAAEGTIEPQPELKHWRVIPQDETEAKMVKELWESTLTYAKAIVSAPNYHAWLEKSKGLAIEGDTLVVGVRHNFVAEYLAANQKSLLERCLCRDQQSVKDLVFIADQKIQETAHTETHQNGQGKNYNAKRENVPPKRTL